MNSYTPGEFDEYLRSVEPKKRHSYIKGYETFM